MALRCGSTRASWKQMFHEAWRIERDFLYDPHYHGLNLNAAEEKYAPFVEALDSRDDLNYLFQEMLGELTLGHVFVGGGETPDVKKTKTGLLGADFKIENGRYRFARIYDGENWNPQLRAPLTQPGAEVKAGEYLLTAQGADVQATEDVYSYFRRNCRHAPRPESWAQPRWLRLSRSDRSPRREREEPAPSRMD